MNFLLTTTLPDGTRVIENTTDVTTLAPELKSASHIALLFPKWTDGRAYSQARLLRSRVGFRGVLIAGGEVLADMLPLLQRCGFDAALLRADQNLDAARRALGYFDNQQSHYQADLITKLPHFARGEHERHAHPEARA